MVSGIRNLCKECMQMSQLTEQLATRIRGQSSVFTMEAVRAVLLAQLIVAGEWRDMNNCRHIYLLPIHWKCSKFNKSNNYRSIRVLLAFENIMWVISYV